MSNRKLLLLPILTLIASCQSSIVPIDTACSWVKPIYTNEADRKSMARELKEQLVTHNQLYKSHCQK